MVSVLTSSAVNCVFESWLCMQHEQERAKTGWIGTGIVCQSGTTNVHVYPRAADRCFGELAL